MAREKLKSKTAAQARTDGRKPLVSYLRPHVIKQLKKAALDDERHTYEIVEEAARDWLAARTINRKRKVK